MAVPMDIDEGLNSSRVNLIRAVRTIDDNAILPLTGKIHKLWLLLSASASTRLHGVEETVLRWLCKHMTGNTEDAEIARRYPLTWAVMGHTFQKIPPQTLGKVLADRKFIAILRQALDQVSKPTDDDESRKKEKKTNKRKRANAMPDNMTELRSIDGCIRSSVNILEALATLLGYGQQDSRLASPQHRVGLEHIKSLFSSSSEETRDITSRLLWCCANTAREQDGSISKDQESWVGIATAIWDLRLHSKDDTFEFARHLYSPICAAIGALGNSSDSTTAQKIWKCQFEQLLSVSFIRPSRLVFVQDGSVQGIRSALEITSSTAITSSAVVWNAATRTSRDQSDPKSKAEHASWVKAIFSAVLEALESTMRVDKNKAIAGLLATAIATHSIPDSDTLREVTNKNAFGGGTPDWELIGQIIACDPDVFLTDTAAEDVLFEKATAGGSDEQTRNIIVVGVMLPLMHASAKARDLTGFIRRWHQSLCQVTETQDRKTWSTSIWFDLRIRQQLADLLQTSLSTTQVSRLFEFLDTPEPSLAALLVILEGLCAGVRDEEYAEAVDAKVFTAAFQDKKYKKIPSDVLSLRWRVAGYMAAWEKSNYVYRLWDELKSSLKKTLKSGELSDIDTLEAFRCCYQIWLANYRGGNHEADTAKLGCAFLKRLIPEIPSKELLLLRNRYLDLVFGSLPRFVELGDAAAPELSDMLKTTFLAICKQTIEEDTVDEAMLIHVRQILRSDAEDQESLMDALMGQLLNILDGAESEVKTPQQWELSVVLLLEEFPTESWTRTRRKHIMASWKKSQSKITKTSTKDATYGTSVLRLLVKVLQQPTFFDCMGFDDVLVVASLPTQSHQDFSALADRFVETTLKHVVESTEQTSADYLKAASIYLDELDAKHPTHRDFVILRALALALQSNPAKARSTLLDLEQVREKLRDTVRRGLASFHKTAPKAEASTDLKLDSENSHLLSTILSAADCLPNGYKSIKLPKDNSFEQLSSQLIENGNDVGWKLKRFLLRNNPDAYDPAVLVAQLEQSTGGVAENSINNFTRAIINNQDTQFQATLLDICVSGNKDRRSAGPLIAVRNIVERIPVPNDGVFDCSRIHKEVASLLTQTTSLDEFKQLVEIIILLLDRHSASMSQFSIELTLNAVAEVASSRGPNIYNGKSAGEVYEGLYRLVAMIIRRHRRRLDGHFPILVATLQALLRVLLTDPLARITGTTGSSSMLSTPAWLGTRLRARHGARFARLLTLICEPSAAAVARSRRTVTGSAATHMLDSATDAAKRSAGQDMFHVVESYVKLQLEVAVSQDVRKALEPGIYSVLNVTPEGCRRVMNESLDVNGRAVFRELFAGYKKFGRWSGV